jgi:hypothetical protein
MGLGARISVGEANHGDSVVLPLSQNGRPVSFWTQGI